MQKMVGVINDNLKSVINGIRTHRDDTEKKLNAINAKIDEKIKEASRHKTDVDASRALITSFENEIASLEKDLKELTERFADKNFVGILDAANKEINTRIIEKRAQINRYTDNIKLINNKNIVKTNIGILPNIYKSPSKFIIVLCSFTAAASNPVYSFIHSEILWA